MADQEPKTVAQALNEMCDWLDSDKARLDDSMVDALRRLVGSHAARERRLQ